MYLDAKLIILATEPTNENTLYYDSVTKALKADLPAAEEEE